MTDDLVPLRVTYDAEANAAYIYFVPEITGGGVDKTVSVDPNRIGGMVNLDVDPDGRILGIEELDASALLPTHLSSGSTAHRCPSRACTGSAAAATARNRHSVR